MLRTGFRILIAISIVMAAVAPATADDVSTILEDESSQQEAAPSGITRNPPGLSDSELDARLAFLEERLDGGEKYAKFWQWGWTTGYGLGIAIGSAQAIDEDDGKKRTNHIVTAAKGVIGTSRMLLSRHPGRNGADAMREIPGDSREAKLQRLEKGEETLQQVAKRAKQRTNWKPHAGNLALNAAGGAFIFGFGRDKDAGISMGVGIAVGTLQILSAPKRGIQDLSDYETEFGMKTADRFDWMIVPTMGGAALRVTF
jgi:hypothetical protein